MYGSYQVIKLPDVTGKVICTIHILVLPVTSRLPNGYQALLGKCMEVTKLPGYQI